MTKMFESSSSLILYLLQGLQKLLSIQDGKNRNLVPMQAALSCGVDAERQRYCTARWCSIIKDVQKPRLRTLAACLILSTAQASHPEHMAPLPPQTGDRFVYLPMKTLTPSKGEAEALLRNEPASNPNAVIVLFYECPEYPDKIQSEQDYLKQRPTIPLPGSPDSPTDRPHYKSLECGCSPIKYPKDGARRLEFCPQEKWLALGEYFWTPEAICIYRYNNVEIVKIRCLNRLDIIWTDPTEPTEPTVTDVMLNLAQIHTVRAFPNTVRALYLTGEVPGDLVLDLSSWLDTIAYNEVLVGGFMIMPERTAWEHIFYNRVYVMFRMPDNEPFRGRLVIDDAGPNSAIVKTNILLKYVYVVANSERGQFGHPEIMSFHLPNMPFPSTYVTAGGKPISCPRGVPSRNFGLFYTVIAMFDP